MPWSAAIDTAIGMSFVFLVVSLVVSRINEFVATLLQWRAKGLSQGLTALVGEPAPQPQPRAVLASMPFAAKLRPGTAAIPMQKQAGDALLSAQQIKNHPLVRGLDAALQRNRRISYLPAETFATAVIDTLARAPVANDERVAQALAHVAPQFLSVAGQAAHAALTQGVNRDRVLALDAAVQPGDERNRAAVDRLLALLDEVPNEMTRIRAGLAKIALDVNPAANALATLFAASGSDLGTFGRRIERWYDDAMDRVSGWYKRRVQLAIAVYGAALVIVFNIDAAGIADNLWRAPVERAAVATAAAAQAQGDLDSVDRSLHQLTSLSIPIGWDLSAKNAGQPVNVERRIPDNVGLWLRKIVGMTLSAIAISLGAPFWFDALGRLSSLRNTGKKPERVTNTQ